MIADQLKAARAILGWSREDLAREAQIGESMIRAVEGTGGRLGERTYRQVVKALRETLEAAGIEFLDQDVPSVRLARPDGA